MGSITRSPSGLRHTLRVGVILAGLLAATPPLCPPANAEMASGTDMGTDRDAFTPSTKTVPPGKFLSEGSYVYIDNRSGLPTNNIPEYVIRIGATEWLEWRLGVDYGVNAQGNVVTSVEVGEGRFDGKNLYEANLLYGLKANLTSQDGLLPESCLIMEAGTPTNGNLWGTVPVATFVGGWELPGPFRLDSSLRYSYSEWDTGWFSRWAPTVILRMPVTERWEVHAEWFETATQGLPVDTVRPFFSPGTHYLLTKNFEIGLRVGWGLNDTAAGFFSDAGFGWRY
ncbi:MAG: transporter [Planctomycetota bacterium]|nr:MAG: transporter [Planctomycetota bacterium]